MRKLLFISFIGIATCLLFSCQINGEKKIKQPRILPIEKFVSDFLDSHKDYFNNDITKKEGDKIFQETLEKSIDSLHLFEGLPIQLQSITQDNKGKYVAQFRCAGYQTPYNRFEYQDSINDVVFDIWGEVPDSVAKQLKEDVIYMFYGKFISFLKYGAAMIISNSRPTVYTPEINIRPDDIFDEEIEVSMGMSYWDIDSIVEFRGREFDVITTNTSFP